MNIQCWFPLGWTGWISLHSKGLSRVFYNTTVQKHQFFGVQPSLWFNSHICTWLLEKPQLWLYGPLLAKWCLCLLIRPQPYEDTAKMAAVCKPGKDCVRHWICILILDFQNSGIVRNECLLFKPPSPWYHSCLSCLRQLLTDCCQWCCFCPYGIISVTL